MKGGIKVPLPVFLINDVGMGYISNLDRILKCACAQQNGITCLENLNSPKQAIYYARTC